MSNQSKPKSEDDADLRAHSRIVQGKYEKQAPILKGFQSELGGRLSGATRGSRYATQLELAYDERYGGEQDVQDALFKRHFNWMELIPVIAVAMAAAVYYYQPAEINSGFAWMRSNVVFVALMAGLVLLALNSLGLLKRLKL